MVLFIFFKNITIPNLSQYIYAFPEYCGLRICLFQSLPSNLHLILCHSLYMWSSKLDTVVHNQCLFWFNQMRLIFLAYHSFFHLESSFWVHCLFSWSTSFDEGEFVVKSSSFCLFEKCYFISFVKEILITYKVFDIIVP